MAAPEDLAGVRLLNGAGGILLGIQQQAAVVALHHQKRLARKHIRRRLHTVAAGGRVADGDIAPQKGVQVRYILQGGDGLELFHGPLQEQVLGVAVDHPELGSAVPYIQLPAHHIKAAAHAQQVVQLAAFLRKGSVHNAPPFSRIMGIVWAKKEPGIRPERKW